MSFQLLSVVLLVAVSALFIARVVRRTLSGYDPGDGCHDCARPRQPRGLARPQSRTGANEQKPVARREPAGTFFSRSGTHSG